MYFSELNPELFSQVRKHEIIGRFPLINAVAAGSQLGKIFIGKSNELIIIHKANFSLVVLHPEIESAEEFVAFFESSAGIPQYFHIYDPPQSLINILTQRDKTFNLKSRNRIQLRTNALPNVDNYLQNTLHELSLSKIDEANFDYLSELGLDLENRFWSSKRDFLKNAIGVCIQDKEKRAVSICYSACLVDQIAEVDIMTSAKNQRSGLGRAMTNEFIKMCIQSGITPNWDCFDDNKSSLATAKGAGFQETYKYQFLSIFNKMKNS